MENVEDHQMSNHPAKSDYVQMHLLAPKPIRLVIYIKLDVSLMD